MTDLKSQILNRTHGIAEDTVTLDGLGDIRVRGLSREQVFELNEAADNVQAFERKFLALGMVSPEMTEEEVGAWQKIPGAGSEIQQVSDKIEELSGLKKGADKSGV